MANANEPRWVDLPVTGKDDRTFNVNLIESYWAENDHQTQMTMASGNAWRIELTYNDFESVIGAKK